MRGSLLVGCVVLLGLGTGCGKDDDDALSPTGGSQNGSATKGGSDNGGGATTGGSDNGGGATTGGSDNGGGATTGGGDNGGGGTTTGGAPSGGASSGGSITTGGAATGGDPTTTGGQTGATGGAVATGGASGGTDTGGSAAGGGSTTGGSAAGGSTTGGSATGGSTGGAATGGSTTGGSATGGSTTGGSATGGSTTGGAGGAGGAAGFVLRIPSAHTLECTGTAEPGLDPTQNIMDADTLCTFQDGAVSGVIYVQATPVSCVLLMSAQPTYDVVAQLMIDGVIEPLPGAVYDYGGNHGNDSLEFTYGGKTFRYYHSSFMTSGWRSCQAMDCAQITEDDVTEDGCTCDRTLPIHCSPVQADGSYDPIEVDDFAVCPYDTTCGT